MTRIELEQLDDRPARETRPSLIHTAWADWEEREREVFLSLSRESKERLS